MQRRVKRTVQATGMALVGAVAALLLTCSSTTPPYLGDGDAAADVAPSLDADGSPCGPGLTLCGPACVDVMTSTLNCGKCNNACVVATPSTATCVSGRCFEVLVSGLSNPAGVAVNSANVYFTVFDVDGAVMYGTGGPTSVFEANQDSPLGLVLDSHAAYWTNFSGTVMSVSLNGGAPTVLASGQLGPTGLAVDGARVYFTNFQNASVVSVQVDGGTPTVIATGQIGANQVAVDSNYVYWALDNASGGAVMRAPLDGGDPDASSVLTTTNGPVLGLAIDKTDAYFTADGHVMRVPLVGGAATMLAATAAMTQGLALNDGQLYWIDGAMDGGLRRAPTDGGSATTLYSYSASTTDQPQYPTTIAVDLVSVYWTDRAMGTLLKLSPK